MLTIFLLCALFALSGATEPQVETRAEQHPPLDKVVSAAHDPMEQMAAVEQNMPLEERPEELLAEEAGRLEEEEAQAQEAAGAEELGDGVESRSGCPSGWSQYGSRCFVFFSSPRTWPEAERYCLHSGANLASVHSLEEYHYIQGIVRRSTGGFPRTWIGGTDTAQDRLWFWSDGSRFDNQLWNRGEPNNAGGREYCMEMNSGAMLTIFLLCALFALSGATGAEELGDGVESRSGCPSGWSQYGSRCFVFISSSSTWPEAEQHCLHFGANLASIHSFGEYHFIQETVRRSTGGFPRTWIGGADAFQNFLWFWSDGSRFDYQLWGSKEPNNYGNTEHCVEMNYGAFQNLQTLS
ncbi:C-type mannose receptor 2-like [Centroberyx affinis]|uniref:C-type mannose receptor 2-like n=1 Tax=Centroberyx affinis TaxID=166261 RepID=UPI003A5C2966